MSLDHRTAAATEEEEVEQLGSSSACKRLFLTADETLKRAVVQDFYISRAEAPTLVF
jgi:hypothetical protein